jgi:transposase
MSLKRQGISPIPERTADIARAAFPKGNIYMQMRDEFGSIYTDDIFADLYPQDGQSAIPPWQLALITVMQFAENLSDRQTADAVRDRIAWKYALSLELTDSGFDFSVLSEFRGRLVENEAGNRLLDTLLTLLKERGLIKKRGQQRTDSTHVLAAIRKINQLEMVGETLRNALNNLAVVSPDWLREWVPEDWYDRYSNRMEQYRLPKSAKERHVMAETIGEDGYQLLRMVYTDDTPAWLQEVPAVETLRQVWLQQYWLDDGCIRKRELDNMPLVNQWIQSPYDIEARYCTKRNTGWVGYRVHLTETCDEKSPRIITQVMTTAATEQDNVALDDIQVDLQSKDLLPKQHIVDAGYVNTKNLINSEQRYKIDLVGPAPKDTSWQARDEQGLDVTKFTIHWEERQVICPAGETSKAWYDRRDRHKEPIIHIIFELESCGNCVQRVNCTRGKGARTLKLRPQERHEALQTARQREQSEEFKEIYRKRAGVEGTISEGVRDQGLRRTRYVGLKKTHFQSLATATAVSLTRTLSWLNEIPLAATRKSHFVRLAA